MGLAHARGTQEEEGADGAAGVPESGPVAGDGADHLVHGLVLPDDFPAEDLAETGEAGGLGGGHFLYRDAGHD